MELDSGGVLVKTSFDIDFEVGDVFRIAGTFKKNKDREFIYVSSPAALINEDFKKIDYHKLGGCASVESCRKKIGTAVQFEGTLSKKIFRSLDFKMKNNQTMRVYVPESMDLDIKELLLNQAYLIRGVLDENSSGARVLATEIFDKSTATSGLKNAELNSANKTTDQKDSPVSPAKDSNGNNKTETRVAPKPRQSLLKSEAPLGHESVTLFSLHSDKTESKKAIDSPRPKTLRRVVAFLFSVI